MHHRNLVLVEDNDDVHVVKNLCRSRGIRASHAAETDTQSHFAIKRKDGVENIIETLDVEVDASGLETSASSSTLILT